METKDKLFAVQMSPEILSAVTLLIAAFKERELKSHIRFEYNLEGGEVYEITFMPITNKFTFKGGVEIKK